MIVGRLAKYTGLLSSIALVLCLFTTQTAFPLELKYGSQFPPSYSLGVGYNLFSLSGSNRVVEYYEPDDSMSVEASLEAYPLPHRFHLETTVETDDEMFLDAGYAYSDLLIGRVIITEFVHNEEKVYLPEKDADPLHLYNDRNPGAEFHEDTMTTRVMMRLKYPDYPFHLFGRYFNYHKTGKKQQRFLTGYFTTPLIQQSRARDVSYETEEYEFGTNGHFGPVEIQYLHREKEFQPEGNVVLYDDYPDGGGRSSDIYPHNLLPRIGSSSDYLMFHSSYTGRITSSLTLMSIRADNEQSGVGRDILGFSGQLRYLPFHELGFFLNYSYRETDEDAPAEMLLQGATTYNAYHVRSPLGTKRGRVHLYVRYRPYGKLNLIGGVEIYKKVYAGTDEWLLIEDGTERTTWSLKAYGRPIKGLKMTAEYRFNDYHKHAFNTDPDASHELKFRANYLPFHWLNALVIYHGEWAKRDNLLYYDPGVDDLLGAGSSKRGYHHLTVLFTLIPSEKTSISAGYAYYRNRIRHLLAFGMFAGDGSLDGGMPFFEDDVPYTDESNQYFVGLTHRFNDRMALNAYMRHVVTSGRFALSSPETSGIDSLSALKSKEAETGLGITIKGSEGIEFVPSVKYRRYDDEIEDRYDGEAVSVFMMVSKRW